jgi:hypothetical protein
MTSASASMDTVVKAMVQTKPLPELLQVVQSCLGALEEEGSPRGPPWEGPFAEIMTIEPSKRGEFSLSFYCLRSFNILFSRYCFISFSFHLFHLKNAFSAIKNIQMRSFQLYVPGMT